MRDRSRCKYCGAEFEYTGVAVEGKIGHTATQYKFKRIKEGNKPNCNMCNGGDGLIWLPALETIKV